MWHTSRGDRILLGSEANLFANAVDTMIDALLLHVDVGWVEEEAVYQTGIQLFDSLSPSQRIGLLYSATKYLLTETDTVSQPSAVLDAAVAAVFVEVRDQVAIEVGLYQSDTQPDPSRNHWRKLVLEAYQDILRKADQASDGMEWEPAPEDVFLPEETSLEMAGWECLIDELVNSILWDRDFEMADIFLDADPAMAKMHRELMGIKEGYFTEIPADPPAYETMRLASVTRELIRSKPR